MPKVWHWRQAWFGRKVPWASRKGKLAVNRGGEDSLANDRMGEGKRVWQWHWEWNWRWRHAATQLAGRTLGNTGVACMKPLTKCTETMPLIIGNLKHSRTICNTASERMKNTWHTWQPFLSVTTAQSNPVHNIGGQLSTINFPKSAITDCWDP